MGADHTNMKGWVTLFSPGRWSGEDARWAKQAKKDGSWLVLKFCDLLEYDEEEFKDTPYECQVLHINLAEVPEKEMASAFRSCGWREEGGKVLTERGDLACEGDLTYVKLEVLADYGLGAPLFEARGKRYLRVRAEARRFAEECMRDADLLEERLDRPVNKVGSTAREFGVGDVYSALFRGPATAEKSLTRKLYGMPPLQEPGEALKTAKVIMKQSDLRKCPFTILVPEHYRADGSCKCDDPEERKMMIKKWGYKEKQFKDIPMRDDK